MEPKKNNDSSKIHENQTYMIFWKDLFWVTHLLKNDLPDPSFREWDKVEHKNWKFVFKRYKFEMIISLSF